jgi:hypothetical protein
MAIEGDVSTMPPQTGTTSTSPSGQMTSTAKAETAAVGQSAKEAGREVMSEVSDQVSAVTDTAKEQINTFVNRARDELSTQGEARGEQLVSAIQSFSRQFDALMRGDSELAGELGTMARDAQRRVHSYASSLDARGPRALVDDVSSFARRRPIVFLAAAGAAGFAIGRLIRSGAMQGTQSPDTRSDFARYGTSGTPLPPPDELGLPPVSGQGATTGTAAGALTGDTVGVTRP